MYVAGKEWAIVHPCCLERVRDDKRTRHFLKSNGSVKVLSGCARRLIIVSGTKINAVLRG